MNREQYSYYKFEVFLTIVGNLLDGWVYKIYGTPCTPYNKGIIESAEYFDSENEARFAAIGHIDLLESGPDE